MSNRTCSIDNCERPRHGHAMCKTHYMRWRRRQPDISERVLCSVLSCERPQHGRAMCRAHYMRWWRGEIEAPPPNLKTRVEDRFWSKVNKTDECWVWTAGLFSNGYGQFWDGNKIRGAHRYAYELAYGSLDGGLVIDHLCRNIRCVRPDHLEQVTSAVNSQRGYGCSVAAARIKEEARTRTHCKRGHLLTSETTYVTPREGWRICRPCKVARQGKRIAH